MQQLKRTVLISGDRDWDNSELDWMLTKVLLHLKSKGYTRVVHGAARGVDTKAGSVAKKLGLEVAGYPAEWEKHKRPGRKNPAGPIRNRKMYDTEKPELVIGFHKQLWNSKGTLDMLRYAQEQGARVRLVNNQMAVQEILTEEE